jgi:hypothetical protein
MPFAPGQLDTYYREPAGEGRWRYYVLAAGRMIETTEAAAKRDVARGLAKLITVE